ncbi:FAD-dependent oxidoreductase [Lacticaseibacillus jixiensis]|uniref:FAD-dependent oxidoreductase n=1 Tax=Lacticaseibacillus jixiensis TaxID=3231926 RepID=UPI0036F208FF
MSTKAFASKHYQATLVVVGGGMSGLLAALAASKQGVETLLIHNRPVLGGNASSEIRMHICGADHHAERPNVRETGLLEELLLKNKYVNSNNSFHVFDTVLWEAATMQPHLQLLLNTHIDAVTVVDQQITQVSGVQLTTETHIVAAGKLFVDATGDGVIGTLAGNTFMQGREAQATFDEPMAPAVADSQTMGNSLMFTSQRLDHPVTFQRPQWAQQYTEAALANRYHAQFDSGYWWIEAGGDGKLDTTKDYEAIRDELVKSLYGIWDHIKNSGAHPESANYALDWVQMLPGKRESRRLKGAYVLTANDLLQTRQFDDAIAYGGWPMDLHVVGGITNRAAPTTYYPLPDVYQIPYRCLYAADIANLFLAGRNISVSHLAFGSTRVMATCAVIGQAVGLAAALADRFHCLPAGVLAHIQVLQQLALQNDLYIPGVTNDDPQDIARRATVSASSALPEWPADHVLNGIARPVHEDTNGWRTEADRPAWLDLRWPQPQPIQQVIVTLDSNLSEQIMPTLSESILASEEVGVQQSLIKTLTVTLKRAGQVVATMPIKDNYQRHLVLNLADPVLADELCLDCLETNGAKQFTIFEVRAYASK